MAPKQIISIWVKHLDPREKIESIGKERGNKLLFVMCVTLLGRSHYSGSRRQQ